MLLQQLSDGDGGCPATGNRFARVAFRDLNGPNPPPPAPLHHLQHGSQMAWSLQRPTEALITSMFVTCRSLLARVVDGALVICHYHNICKFLRSDSTRGHTYGCHRLTPQSHVVNRLLAVSSEASQVVERLPRDLTVAQDLSGASRNVSGTLMLSHCHSQMTYTTWDIPERHRGC